jgi:hypothetical protein
MHIGSHGRDVDGVGALADLDEVIGQLQLQPVFVTAAERFGQADGHLGGDAGTAGNHVAEGLTTDTEEACAIYYTKRMGCEALFSNEKAGVLRWIDSSHKNKDGTQRLRRSSVKRHLSTSFSLDASDKSFVFVELTTSTMNQKQGCDDGLLRAGNESQDAGEEVSRNCHLSYLEGDIAAVADDPGADF